jgi:hypothetical protein
MALICVCDPEVKQTLFGVTCVSRFFVTILFYEIFATILKLFCFSFDTLEVFQSYLQ